MAESLESRKHERKATFDVPLPMKRKDMNTPTDVWSEESSNKATPAGTMAFSLLTKRGNRQQVSICILLATMHFPDNQTRLALWHCPPTQPLQLP